MILMRFVIFIVSLNILNICNAQKLERIKICWYNELGNYYLTHKSIPNSPDEYTVGGPMGDFANMIFSKHKVKTIHYFYPINRCQRMLKMGAVDMIPYMAPNPQRNQYSVYNNVPMSISHRIIVFDKKS